jgi:hypothetical protein
MKKSVGIKMDPEIYERAMRMVYWTPGLSLGLLIEKLLVNCVDQIEKERGKPFEARE